MKFYMHKRAMDIFIQVLNVNNDQYTVQYHNLGYTGNPWLLPVPISTITISDLTEWIEINPFTHRVI